LASVKDLLFHLSTPSLMGRDRKGRKGEKRERKQRQRKARLRSRWMMRQKVLKSRPSVRMVEKRREIRKEREKEKTSSTSQAKSGRAFFVFIQSGEEIPAPTAQMATP